MVNIFIGSFTRCLIGSLPATATALAILVEPALAQLPAPPAAVSSLDSSAFDALVEYQRGQQPPRVFGTSIFATINRVRLAAPLWIQAAGPDHQPRRRLAVATYILELLGRDGSDQTILWDPPTKPAPAPDALQWACDLLREQSPLRMERLWHAGLFGVLERFGLADEIRKHLIHAQKRFPDEPRWALVRAVAEELDTWPEERDARAFSISASRVARIENAFQQALTFTENRTEVHLRWGYLHLRRGRIDDALAHFGQAGTSEDVYLRFWLRLFEGRAYDQAHRTKDAIAAYERALAEAPFAQSAALSLASALVDDQRPTEASALVTRLLVLQPTPPDPWQMYIAPDLRLWTPIVAQLRRAISQ